MNKAAPATFATLLALGAPATFASSSTDLIVSGSITPSACTPTLERNGVIEFGKIPAKGLNTEAFTPLPVNTVPLTVTCQSAAVFALRFNDNRAGSSASAPHGFGLGLINTDEKMGVFHLTLSTPFADDAPIQQLRSLNGGQTWVKTSNDAALPALQLAGFGDTSSGAWAPVSIKALRVSLQVRTFIAPAQGLTLDHEVPLDGSATLDLIYL